MGTVVQEPITRIPYETVEDGARRQERRRAHCPRRVHHAKLPAADGVHHFEVVAGGEGRRVVCGARDDEAVALDDGH